MLFQGKIIPYVIHIVGFGLLLQGNFSVLQSPDEYSINVESNRGLKEFNFDRIFMPENSQDQVFEDTYVSSCLPYPQ